LIGLVWAVGLGFGTVVSVLKLFEIEMMRGALVAVMAMWMDYIGRFVYDTRE